MRVRIVALLAVGVAALAAPVARAEPPVVIETDARGVTSLRLAGDRFGTEFLAPGRVLGGLVVHYRWAEPGARWKQARTDSTEVARPLPREVRAAGRDAASSSPRYEATWQVAADGRPALSLVSRFDETPQGLDWTIEVRNVSDRPIEVGDLAMPLPMNTRGGDTPAAIFEQTVVKHHFIGGHGSFLYWIRPNGVGPMLVMTPRPDTRLEFHELTDQIRDVREDFYVYVHSAVRGGLERRGTWRLPHTSRVLAPAGRPGDTLACGFAFQPAADLQGVRDVLVARGVPDVRVVPGMTVPSDLTARVAIRSTRAIAGLDAEHPAETHVTPLPPPSGEGAPAGDARTVLYEVRFTRLGEHWIDVREADGRTTRLDLFVTEPIETLVRKRAAFLVSKQQHRRPDRWYDGLFSVWDMRVARLRGPDDTDGYDGWWGYVLASDDPALGKAPFIAAKNRHYPDAGEVAALEYYLERFVWGKLQRTDREMPYPYGIYGVPNWHELRQSEWGFDSSGKGLEHVWRMYDYPHLVMLYFHLYELARQYPGVTRYLDAAGYLERATATAKAYFTYPYQLRPFYEVYKWGCYNELVILDLIDALEIEGRDEDAAWLRTEWEKKVRYFIYDDPYPFRSEYAFDTTAFESTQAIARYAMAHPPTPDERAWYDVRLDMWWSHPEVPFVRVSEFMERQMSANLALRGVIEPAYYYMGSDYRRESSRYTLSYMAQMGGWALLDYALHVAADPAETLRTGYASFLSSWALVNSGTEASNYGYWYPGPGNDGAAGWGFNAEKFGPTWIRKDVGRGAWPYDGEIDLGFGGALRAAATIVTDDPVFGWIALGGTLERRGGTFSVVPRDGIRQRLHLVGRAPADRLHVWLDWDGFARERPVTLRADRTGLAFDLENRSGRAHQTRLRLRGLVPGRYTLSLDGQARQTLDASEGGEVAFTWSVTSPAMRVSVERAR